MAAGIFEKYNTLWKNKSRYKNKVLTCFSFMTQISLGSISPKDYSTPFAMENLGVVHMEIWQGKKNPNVCSFSPCHFPENTMGNDDKCHT